jgi:hypothetical protein
MVEVISDKMCAVKVRNAKLRNYLNIDIFLVILLVLTSLFIEHLRRS